MCAKTVLSKLKNYTKPFLWGSVLGIMVYVMRMMDGKELSPIWVLVSALVFVAGHALRDAAKGSGPTK